MKLEVGTPLWAGSFGCVQWVGPRLVGVTFLDQGSRSVRATLTHSGAVRLALAFLEMIEYGRVTVVQW